MTTRHERLAGVFVQIQQYVLNDEIAQGFVLFEGVVSAEVEQKPATEESKVMVNHDALLQVLSALNGPAHHIRELQATRNLPGEPNPIDVLIEDLANSD